MPPDEDTLAVQMGIISWGDGCGRPGVYSVNTRVSFYRPWIEKTIGKGALPYYGPLCLRSNMWLDGSLIKFRLRMH